MASYVGAIDQGTTSTRFIVFDQSGGIVATAQKEHQQIYPQPGWVEHDAEEIWQRTVEVITTAMQQADLRPEDLAAIGITNQRETTVVWNRKTGKPVANAIVWQDTRVAACVEELSGDGGQQRFRGKTGLPLATYFSALKIRWILENVPGVREQAEAGDALFGNLDSFLVWRLTGGPEGGVDGRGRCGCSGSRQTGPRDRAAGFAAAGFADAGRPRGSAPGYRDVRLFLIRIQH